MAKLKQFVWNGILITLVSLLIRTVSVSFNVYLSNRVGAVAMGLFTLISTVYGFAITVATSGIGLATTRLVAEALGRSPKEGGGSPWENPRVICTVKKCMVYALCFSLGSGLVLFFFAPAIGVHLLHDSRTVASLKILAFTLPPIALSSVFSGYFTAVRRVYKNALVQVVGQILRIYGCVFFIGFLPWLLLGICTLGLLLLWDTLPRMLITYFRYSDAINQMTIIQSEEYRNHE